MKNCLSHTKIKTSHLKERCEFVLKHIKEERERRDKEAREVYNKLSWWGKLWATNPDEPLGWNHLYGYGSEEVAKKLLALCVQADEFVYLTAEDCWYIK